MLLCHSAMLRALKSLLSWAAVAAVIWWFWPEPALRHDPGVRIDVFPVQRDMAPRVLPDRNGYSLMAVASYSVHARVLHTKRYWVDGNDLVPYDVALGWGAMSDQKVLDGLKISQSNRFFFYRWQNQPPIPPEQITSQAANVHVISANSEVAKAVKKLRKGQFVSMKGYLVNARRGEDFYWPTSLRRDDTGNGACELFYVEAITVRDEPV